MSRAGRVKRPKGELRQELVEQLALLRSACETFDRGMEAAGKHISLTLRILLHDQRQSRSLLDQLGLRAGRFLDSAGPLNPTNLISECKLVSMGVSRRGGRYMPLISTGGGQLPMNSVPFVNWWNDPVLKDKRGRIFCRRELVLHVADTDGGAHVDPELDEAYMDISRKNSLGWIFINSDITKALQGRPELACMRQIAHELLSTIHERIPKFAAYAEPVIPAS